jgi:hypothetical protein
VHRRLPFEVPLLYDVLALIPGRRDHLCNCCVAMRACLN